MNRDMVPFGAGDAGGLTGSNFFDVTSSVCRVLTCVHCAGRMTIRLCKCKIYHFPYGIFPSFLFVVTCLHFAALPHVFLHGPSTTHFGNGICPQEETRVYCLCPFLCMVSLFVMSFLATRDSFLLKYSPVGLIVTWLLSQLIFARCDHT